MRSGFGIRAGLVALVIGGWTEASAQPLPYPPGTSCIAALTLPAEYVCEARVPAEGGSIVTEGCLEIDSGPVAGTFVLTAGGTEFLCTCHPGGDGSDEDGDPFAEAAVSNEFLCDGEDSAIAGSFRGNGRLIPNAVAVSSEFFGLGAIRCRLGPCESPQ